jgi:hypothetical protein
VPIIWAYEQKKSSAFQRGKKWLGVPWQLSEKRTNEQKNSHQDFREGKKKNYRKKFQNSKCPPTDPTF